MRRCRHRPSIDLVVRGTSPAAPEQAITILAARSYGPGRELDAATELAYSFHQVMMLLVLYYLDHRRGIGDPLPTWMFLYGLTFDEMGFVIRIHHPIYLFETICAPRHDRWGAYSFHAQSDYQELFNPSLIGRPLALAALLRIRSHAHYVFSQLRNWDGYAAALHTVSISVHEYT